MRGGEADLLDTWKAVILGVLQGLTEFLPVSSSGHLVLGQHLLGFRPPGLVLEVALHLGTLAAVVVVFARDLGRLLAGGWLAIARMASGVPPGQALTEEPGARLLGALVVASAVTAGLAWLAEPWLRATFERPAVAAGMLLATGVLLRAAGRAGDGRKPLWGIGWADAAVVGVAQAIAIIPGISRSGSTIAAGLFRGMERETAARFSFLLSVPAILGAGLLELGQLRGMEEPWPAWPALLPAVGAAAVTGILAISLLLSVVRRGRIALFAYYCWMVGGTALLWLAVQGR
ncbi:MAG: undecaprenyl-diphosphate phosphatase [bacterium]|nr:undecaprenyl-diphosphate phosphatase [bacterium]